MSEPTAKRQKSDKDTPYELIYWPTLPGRGEHIRLILEEAGAAYVDTAISSKDPMQAVLSRISADNVGDDLNPPTLAPPMLKHGSLVISQTPNIALYLAPRLGLAPGYNSKGELEPEQAGHGEDDQKQGTPYGFGDAIYHINQLVLTALDGLCNETHDTHHPIANVKYYEEQKDAAKERAKDYRETRLPKFLGYFERALKGERSGDGPWLYGGKLTVADLVFWQCLDGNKFAFPKALERLEKSGEYKRVFELYEAVKSRPRIKAYLESERRQKYDNGIYRHYPELDDE